jgi:transcriptional regulator with XRE-family HTH domain
MPPETDIYRQIGRRLRARRRALDLTQRQVAQACGITFQQVHRYETGASSITLGRLLSLATVLQAPVTHFIEFDPQPAIWGPGRVASAADAPPSAKL